ACRPGGAAARRAGRPARAWRQPQGGRRARRAALDHGLPWRGARQPPAYDSGNERAAARHGSHRAFGAMQPRAPDLGAFQSGGNRSMVPEGKMRSARAMGVAMALALLAGCGGDSQTQAPAAPVVDQAFVASQQAWRDARLEALLQPDGWTSLAGLHWLELKAHYIGSGERIGNTMRLAFGPARMGLVTRDDDGRYWFTPEQGVELDYNGAPMKGRVRLYDDQGGEPAVIGFDQGKGKLTLLRRGGRHALRLRHADAPARQ